MKTVNYFNYEKELTNEDVVHHAKIIAQASKEIGEIEEAKKRLRDLKETIERHSRYIQAGKIVSFLQGEFDWHKPVQDCVTISSPSGRFPAFVRDMTPDEIQEYSQLEIPFEAEESIVVSSEEEAEKAKNRLKAVGWNVTDEDLNEMVRVEVDDKVHRPDSTESDQPVAQPTDQPAESTEDQTPEYTIEKCESIKYPWNILEKISGKSTIYERFRTKEEAESFMRDFIEEKKPFESNPNARYQIERVFGAWKVLDFGVPESFSKINPRFVQVKCTYHEAKELCEELNSEPEEVDQGLDSNEDQKVISDTANYKIVENPDGSLKTIRKGIEPEKLTMYYNESALAWIVRRQGKTKSEFEKSFSTQAEAQNFISQQQENEGVEA